MAAVSYISLWCERGDSNPYPLRDWILSPARLPNSATLAIHHLSALSSSISLLLFLPFKQSSNLAIRSSSSPPTMSTLHHTEAGGLHLP